MRPGDATRLASLPLKSNRNDMKRAIIAVLVLAAAPVFAVETPGLRPGDLVAVCGDSITEQRRYSLFIEEYLLMCAPQPNLSVMQMGWNGETAPGFLKRMGNDALTFQPQVVTTCFGMNDSGTEPLTAERIDLYRNSMDAVVKTFLKGGVRWVVLGTPGTVDTATYTKTDVKVRAQNLAILAKVAREVAEANGTGFADVNSVMVDVMAKAKAKYGANYQVAGTDGVHPGRNGHLIMAYAFIKGLQCDGDIGTITYDAGGDSATGSEGQKILATSGGKIEVESTRYPFCFYGKPEDPDATTGLLEFLPFNEELNRYRLVVRNAKAPRLAVTWGEATKTFDAAQLEKGINLAAEFLDNPFSKPFMNVEREVADQQAFEVLAVKSLMHSLIGWREQFPDQQATFAQQSEMLLKKCKETRDKSRAAVVPVKHQILIKPAA